MFEIGENLMKLLLVAVVVLGGALCFIGVLWVMAWESVQSKKTKND